MHHSFALFLTMIFGVISTTKAQKWEQHETTKGDTIVRTIIYVDKEGNEIEDSTNTHKIIEKYKDYYLLSSKRFNLKGEPTEDIRGVHHQKIFLMKFFKFYDKNGQSLRLVQDPYYHKQGNATYCIYKYNEHSDLLEVCFYKDELVKDKKTGKVIRNRLDAVAIYKGMIHKYQYKYSRNRKTIKEYSYNLKGEYVERRILKRKRAKKKALERF